MPKKYASPVPRPNAFLYYTVAFFAGLYFRWIFGLRVDRSAIKESSPLFCDCRAHQLARFLYRIHCAVPAKDNYLAAYNFFRNPVLKFVLGLLGVIPKNQFTNDNQANTQNKECDRTWWHYRHFPAWLLIQRGAFGWICRPKHCKAH